MATTTKRKWLEEGLTLLAKSGAGALTIEMLTSRLGVNQRVILSPLSAFPGL